MSQSQTKLQSISRIIPRKESLRVLETLLTYKYIYVLISNLLLQMTVYIKYKMTETHHCPSPPVYQPPSASLLSH
jgi:hypothetical protein